ncbi:c-type cytochrome [Anatilimnocola floriformis]|uniref:c-type cytochrome n=1 Tax=Anatilimnocola floriformis TaxID=2948575 RepID=UPI0020C5690C|nr:c-type cytochrome [Anatilimnocola floriformis]
MASWRYFGAIVCAFSLGVIAAAQEDEEEPFLPGLIAQFQQAKSSPVQRLEAVVAAHWNARPDERLRPGELFTVTYRGVLDVPDDGQYQLHLHGNGQARVLLDGKEWIADQKLSGWASSTTRQLTFGPLPIEIQFIATAWPAQIGLFWSSDRFEREPVPARALQHAREMVVSDSFERGQVLARALRCEACHSSGEQNREPMPAPALDQLAGNLQRDWLVNWLRDDGTHDQFSNIRKSQRRMPFLNIAADEVELLADWLLAGDGKKPKPVAEKPPKADPKKKPRTTAELHAAGENLLRTKGCLACHESGEFGESGLYGGGDLTNIAAKRPPEFFAQWLQKPETLNRDHRMPVFDLTADEREALSTYLSSQGKGAERRESRDEAKERNSRAREIARKYRCDECHRLPEQEQIAKLPAAKSLADLTATSNWEKSCVRETAKDPSGQPLFTHAAPVSDALKDYFSQRVAPDKTSLNKPDGAQLVIENNCLACHSREPQLAGVLPKKFGDKLVRLAESDPELAPQIPALTPPSLNSVGDKLTDAALAGAITRAGPAHRPYLQVQMPKFRLSKAQIEQVSAHFIGSDRIPDYERTKHPEPQPAQLAARALAGKRLVGTDGFSCTACHQVGSVQPVKAPPNARGPTLSMPQNRLRKTWFDRWVRNPARIVPRMEMPSVQTPVRGVLQDNLHDQLAAVWQVLSTPGFEPPLPAPVRTLRFYSSEDNSQQQPLVVTDLIEYEGQMLERAALIGLPNRQNVLFDFATHRLLAWSQGDLARQRTKGKNWYWEPAGSALLTTGIQESELAVEIDGRLYFAVADGQWLAEPEQFRLSSDQASIKYTLRFRRSKEDAQPPWTVSLRVRQDLKPDFNGNGLVRHFELSGVPENAKIHWRLLDAKKHGIEPSEMETSPRGLSLKLANSGSIQVSVDGPTEFGWLKSDTATIEFKGLAQSKVSWNASYRSQLPADEYHVPRSPAVPFTQPPVTIAPGMTGERLTLSTDIMPTALAWRPNGELVVASLKGQVLAFSTNAQATAQLQGELLADGLAAPYGIQAGPNYVDVVAKYGLLKIVRNRDGSHETSLIASGWGYTSDYHDWAVGLPSDSRGNYYIALPCFQDNRADAAKRLRGSVLKLTRAIDEQHHHRMYNFEVLTHGHRFPMGMALNAEDELFVTDNQGNYNPFNELNHVQPGKHYGFVNKGEEKPQELTPPAIDIPHPWTRSVNGICFLNTPRTLNDKQLTAVRGSVSIFGPLEGHLVGCEYDTRRLIRMSLQKVDGEYQGCAYPLTVPTPAEEAPLGPICCEVSPAGELFVGSIRDSGWGAGNNIGEVIRIKVDPAKLGSGLAEMRAIVGGFELEFFVPVEKELAEQLESYSLSSYRRESTPAYGGNDIDRRTEKIAKVSLSPDRKRVILALDQLRTGHVYELRIKSLAPAEETFFPAEAHYTLRRVPK